MMTMDQTSGFGDFNVYSADPFTSSNSPPLNNTDVDVDWTVFENADRYLLRDDSAWITRLSKDFWWNLDRISEMITSEVSLAQQMHPPRSTTKFNGNVPSGPFNGGGGKNFPPNTATPTPSPMQFNGVPPRKIVGQRAAPMANGNSYRNQSMFNNGFASPPPSSSGSAIVRPNHYAPPPMNSMGDKSNIFQAFSSMSISGGGGGGGPANNGHDQDMEYNPFQSKISFDNHMWTGNGQQAIPWQ